MYDICSWGESGFIVLPYSSTELIEDVRTSLISPNELKTASDQIDGYITSNLYSVVNCFVWFVFSLCFLVVLYIGRNIIMVYKNRYKLKIYYILGFGYSELLLCHMIYEFALFGISAIIGFSCMNYISELMKSSYVGSSPSVISVVWALVILLAVLLISSLPYLSKLNREYILEE